MKKTNKSKILLMMFCFVLTLGVMLQNEIVAKAVPVNEDHDYVYLFNDGKYVMYDLTEDRQVDGYPYNVDNGTWKGLPWSSIDTAFVSPVNGKAYIFKGTQYVRYDMEKDSVDEGYPYTINNIVWKGLPWDSIDCAIATGTNKVYFTKGSEYVKYDLDKDCVEPGYPKVLNGRTWEGLPWDSLDCAITMPGGRICYLIKGSQYVKFDFVEDKVISGVKSLAGNWPNLSFTNSVRGTIPRLKKGSDAQKLIRVAIGELGYRETPVNVTKYGEWYGTQSYWCAMFVSWCANQAGISENVIPKHSYCPNGAQWFMDMGRWYYRSSSYRPKPGDIVYFYTEGGINHVGIVESVEGSTLRTIEGNTSDMVARRSYNLSDTYIAGYGSPNYRH